MRKQKEKSIKISISKIINWPLSEKDIKFEISFKSDQSGQTILSKIIKGHYNNENRIMYLNCHQKINYSIDQFNLSIRLSEKLGYAGQIVLGDFNLNLQHLKQNEYLKFPIKDRNQLLIIEVYQETFKQTNKQTNKNKSKSQYKSFLRNELNNDFTKLSRYISKQNLAFIRQKQDFLQKHINKSQSSSRSVNLFSNRTLQTQNLIRTTNYSRDRPSSFSNRRLGVNQNKISDSKISRHNSQSKNSITGLNTKLFTQKYVLEVNSLNILPIDEYYLNQTKLIRSSFNLQIPDSQNNKLADRYRKQVIKLSNTRNNYKNSDYF